MPVPSTAAAFLELVRKSGIAQLTDLDAMASHLNDEKSQTPIQTARLLVRHGVITKFQATQLLRGKWRKFVLGGKYKLLEHIGSGGMGQVYLCEHLRMGRRVAIKILPPDKADDDVCRERFEREARAAAAVDHPNIVRAHDIDHDESGLDTIHFLVMEYVDGSSLQHIVSKFGPLTVARACNYIAQAADGLQHAHDAGLVHRDVKPANLLLDRSGLVKLLDLGLARFLNDADDLTCRVAKRTIIGTADYLAPEQANNGHAADIRADIYSLGVTFFFLLTRRSPFKDGNIAQKLIFHQTDRPASIKKLRPDVPAGVCRIIDRMLAKRPRDRFQQPIAVREALDDWTAAPIAPPPEAEMPQLSRAARRSEPATTSIARNPRSTVHNLSAPAIAAPAPTRWSRYWHSFKSIPQRVSGLFRRRS